MITAYILQPIQKLKKDSKKEHAINMMPTVRSADE
jgi:hypothetical protein